MSRFIDRRQFKKELSLSAIALGLAPRITPPMEEI
jgi:hypothetical protein